MSLNLTSAKFIGPALPEPFVKFDLEKILNQNNLLPKTTGEEGKKLQEIWNTYRRKLRDLGPNSGAIRVRNHIIDPLIEISGYSSYEDGGKVNTREGDENGGVILKTANVHSMLRIWTVETEIDLETPVKRGYAYRFSPVKIAQRVLLTKQEKLGIITDGIELRILISDSARPDSQVIIPLDTDWKVSREVPDTFRFLIAIASPEGIETLPNIIDKARLKQSTVTKELRIQARKAIEGFIQEILDEPQNSEKLNAYTDKSQLAKTLWSEGLIVVYRLLFILKGEASDDPAKSFNFTGSSIWRNTYSPTVSLVQFVRKSIDSGADTGSMLESGLKTVFRMFEEGLNSTELNIAPLGGALFGADSTLLLSQLKWPERGCAKLLDKLLWTIAGRGTQTRERIHYGALNIEDLGRVYEALLELEPGFAAEKMCRLRRSKLEVVVPYAQGEKYKKNKTTALEDAEDTDETEEEDARSNAERWNDEWDYVPTQSVGTRNGTSVGTRNDDDNPRYHAPRGNANSTKIEWIEEINPGQFYLRIGLGRKSTGSFYTPHSFVRFLVQETLGPKIEECSPRDNPYPNKILQIKVLDTAMGSGHFLVEACRFMADKLYEACRLCDEKALGYEQKIEQEMDIDKKKELRELVDEWRNRVIEIPDPDDEILKYLPSSAPEDGLTGFSQKKAEALCKRLVAVHCLYGVDKNPLAVELAKLSLWLESQSEGYPLTFLDHRLVLGDSITGPFFEHLLKMPGSQQPIDDMFNQNLKENLVKTLTEALKEVEELERSIGINLTDITNKQKSKERLENILLPFKVLSYAWSGSIMLGLKECDDAAYLDLARHISETGKLPENIESAKLQQAILKGSDALPYDLTFPEVFFELTDTGFTKKGFDVVLGNPPWDAVKPKAKEFFAGYNFGILNAPTKKERTDIERQLKEDKFIAEEHKKYEDSFVEQHRIHNLLFQHQVAIVDEEKTGGDSDLAKLFSERFYQLIGNKGLLGVLVPSAFHANEGATGIRKLYLEKMALRCCYSFENKKKLFEIDSRFKFALIVAEKSSEGTKEFSYAFYLHNEDWLSKQPNKLLYDIEFARKSGGEYLSFTELRTDRDYEIAKLCFQNGKPFGEICKSFNINFYRELDMTNDSKRFIARNNLTHIQCDVRLPDVLNKVIEQGYFVLHEGKTFQQYTDIWENEPKYLVAINNLIDKKQIISNAQYYRASYRAISGATDGRTLKFSLLPPGIVCGNSAPIEANVKRVTATILFLIGYANSFPFDWCGRQLIRANVNLFILNRLPLVARDSDKHFISHSVLRLVSNHSGYAPLWHEQLGDIWREPNKAPFTLPVLATEQERWEVRSAIDAVVADAYGLNREQYEHMLKSFDRASGPNPHTEICLAKFDELKQIGLDTFTKKHDPYWDIPLNENLPEPVIAIPIPELETNQVEMFASGKRKK